MKKVQEIQLRALDRIGGALAELETLTNPFDIEAKVYFIAQLAKQAHGQLHEANSTVPHGTDCLHADKPGVFDFIFGKGFGV